jgi:hypothetical protein
MLGAFVLATSHWRRWLNVCRRFSFPTLSPLVLRRELVRYMLADFSA